MRRPWYQTVIQGTGIVFAVLITITLFLDALYEASKIVTLNWAVFGTIACILYLAVVHIFLKHYPLTWRAKSGEFLRLTKLQLKHTASVIGIIASLWILFFISSRNSLMLTTHSFVEDGNQCVVQRVTVRNNGRSTVRDVRATITGISAEHNNAVQEAWGGELEKAVQELVGLNLCVSVDKSGPLRAHDGGIQPLSSVTLHPNEEESFDFMRLCKRPVIWHCNYVYNSQTSRWHRKQNPVLPPGGRYIITLSIHGDDVPPKHRKFDIFPTDTIYDMK